MAQCQGTYLSILSSFLNSFINIFLITLNSSFGQICNQLYLLFLLILCFSNYQLSYIQLSYYNLKIPKIIPMTQSIPFNNTFTSDKPIIYPSTWQTGKNAEQLFEQFKQTAPYIIMKNMMECVLGGIWIFMIYVIISALFEMRRLYNLTDESRQKKANRNYLKRQFIISVGFVSFVVFAASIALLVINQDIKYTLFKGIGTWIIILAAYYVYKKVLNKKVSKKLYQRVSSRQQ